MLHPSYLNEIIERVRTYWDISGEVEKVSGVRIFNITTAYTAIVLQSSDLGGKKLGVKILPKKLGNHLQTEKRQEAQTKKKNSWDQFMTSGL